jgi:hypothetical protein
MTNIDNTSSAANTNQSRGSNPIVGFAAALKLKAGGAIMRYLELSASGYGTQSGRMSAQDAASLSAVQSHLAAQKASQDAWLTDVTNQRNAQIHIHNQTVAQRNAARIEDEQGRVLGEVGVENKQLGLKTAGYDLKQPTYIRKGQMIPDPHDVTGVNGTGQQFRRLTQIDTSGLYPHPGYPASRRNPETNRIEAIPGRQEKVDLYNKAQANASRMRVSSYLDDQKAHIAQYGIPMQEYSTSTYGLPEDYQDPYAK